MEILTKICLLGLLIVSVFLVSCSCKPTEKQAMEESQIMIEDTISMVSYSIHDFDCIVVGESTFEDVYAITSENTMIVTSFGGVQEFLLADGR